MSYIKEIFDPVTFEHAKNIVLVADKNKPNKFEYETKNLIDVIEAQNIIDINSNVLDFGCGMGRVSKELISRFNCNVTGIDISEKMKIFAMLYIANIKKFKTVDVIEESIYDICIAIFSLQHVENPRKEIENIFYGLKSNAILVLLNEPSRMVPVNIDSEGFVIWHDDKFDIFGEVKKYSHLIKSVPYEPNLGLSINFYKKNV